MILIANATCVVVVVHLISEVVDVAKPTPHQSIIHITLCLLLDLLNSMLHLFFYLEHDSAT